MTEVTILKIGGKLINDSAALDDFLTLFVQIEGPKILIHGGGRKASELSQQLGIKVKMMDGRRITDDATLDVTVMVYAGLINKTIVARLQANQTDAIGLSGADLNLIQSHRRRHPSIDYGAVGDVDQVNAQALTKLLESGFTPVLCSITHDKNAQLLNTNADTIAAEIAKALAPNFRVKLKFCFEYPGVMEDLEKDTIPIPEINQTTLADLREREIIHAGMLPKIDNALAAVQAGVSRVCICGLNNLLSEKDVTWLT